MMLASLVEPESLLELESELGPVPVLPAALAHEYAAPLPKSHSSTI